MNRRLILLMLALVFVIVFLSVVGFLFIVSQITHGAIELATIGGLIVAAAEVTIGIAITGEVFIQVSSFLLMNKTTISIF